MGKSKLKAALRRHLGKDPVKEKRLKLAHKKEKERLNKKAAGDDEWEDEDSDEAPELVDTSHLVDDEAEEGSEEESEPEENVKPSKKNRKPSAAEEEEDEDEEEEDEDEDEDEEDVALSDIESDDDLEVPDLIPHQKLTIDNHAALTSLRNRIAMPVSKMAFVEHMSLTTAEPVDIPDVNDDLNRELALYKQALDAAKKARELLKKEKVPFERPVDYFAEMMKDDEHMGKIKGKLLEEAERKKRSQEARKLRDLKKFGKQVQVAKLQEREKAKKQTMEKIQILKRKRQGADTDFEKEDDMFDIALDEQTKDEPRHKRAKGDRSSTAGSKAKRQKRDQKYGYGGKKKFAKSNDAMSSGDMGGFSAKKNKSTSFGGGKKKSAPRPGKSKRAARR